MTNWIKADDQQLAFGHPGIEPRWTRSAKDGVGTAYAASSRVWYSLSSGVLNEIYYPTLDRPQIRDIQFLISDGKTFVHEEKRHLRSEIDSLSDHALGFRVTNSDPEGRYRIVKEVIGDPHQDAVLIHTRIEGDENFLSQLKLYVLLAPHLEAGGWNNNGYVRKVAGQKILAAHKGRTWLARGATLPLLKSSCGYVGRSDGWTDLMDNLQMDWEFPFAADGNIALTGQLDLSSGYEFTLGLAFGDTFHSATTTLLQSLDVPFDRHRERFIEQWDRTSKRTVPLESAAGDGGSLYHASRSLLLAHEDKQYQGAIIASLSIPWGDVRGDEDIGGYHLVSTRDMCNSATALLAAGNIKTPRHAIVFLPNPRQQEAAVCQNFLITG